MRALLTSALAVFLSTNARAEGISCWMRCHRPPKIQSANDVAQVLRPSPNPPVKFLARSAGILTTYLGKMLGIQGWRDYHLPANVRGTVVQAVGSSDGLYTIDLAIKQLTVDGRVVQLQRASFVRVEVLPFVRIGAPLPVCKDDEIRVSGELMWDADGFLEVHPKHAREIATVKYKSP
jgi:hypothetical protein